MQAKIRVKNLTSGSILFDKVLNLCNLQKQRTAFYLVTTMFDEAMRHLEIAYQCPIKKGVYEVKSIEFKQAPIPDFIKTNESFHWIVEIKSKIGKIMETASKISSIVDIVEIDY